MASGFPQQNELTGYFWKYINLVNGEDIVQILTDQTNRLRSFYASIPEEKWDYAYAPGKWTLKGTMRHLIDTERVFAYRLLRFLRNDKTALPGYDQDAFMAYVNEEKLIPAELLKEWEVVRASTLSLLASIEDADWDRKGVASNTEKTVRVVAYIIAGHELHHEALTLEQYLQ